MEAILTNIQNICSVRKNWIKQGLPYICLSIKDSLQQQIHFNGNIFGNKRCQWNDSSLYHPIHRTVWIIPFMVHVSNNSASGHQRAVVILPKCPGSASLSLSDVTWRHFLSKTLWKCVQGLFAIRNALTASETVHLRSVDIFQNIFKDVVNGQLMI